MPKKSLSIHPLRLLAEAVAFWRTQPALGSVLVWFFFLPFVLQDLFIEFHPRSDAPSIQRIGDVGYVLTELLVAFVSLWGVTCVLLVGRRMVTSRAGRSRTSFASVRREALRYILPLLGTSIIRWGMTFLWLLLYIVPVAVFVLQSRSCQSALGAMARAAALLKGDAGIDVFNAAIVQFGDFCGPVVLFLPLLIFAIVYQIRTIFASVVVVADGGSYRAALRQSRRVMRGAFLKTLGSLVVLGVILSVPTVLISMAAQQVQPLLARPYDALFSTIVAGAAGAVMSVAILLCLVALYAKLRARKKDGPVEVVPD